MKRERARQRRHERGTQVAELAMVLPLLLFLGLAITEGAGLVRAHQMLNNAAREGAKFSSLQKIPSPGPAIQGVVDTYLKNATANNICAIQNATANAPACKVASATLAVVTVNQCATVTMPSSPNKYASQVDVTYAYQLRYLPRLPWFNLPGTVTLRGRSEFIDFYGC